MDKDLRKGVGKDVDKDLGKDVGMIKDTNVNRCAIFCYSGSSAGAGPMIACSSNSEPRGGPLWYRRRQLCETSVALSGRSCRTLTPISSTSTHYRGLPSSIVSQFWILVFFFENEFLITGGGSSVGVLKGRGLEVGDSAELEGLQRLLHFPEEAALRLSEEEDALFYQVPPIDYLRQVTLDLGGTPPPTTAQHQNVSGAGGHQSTMHLDPSRASVRSLIKRFNEVSSWVTHLIISQPTHEDRKAVLSCILRVALSSWNIGNFNGAMEIVAGLK
ncbi:unnamed protein product [Nesidiocoris tenuis]|uniref:Ras-GEF domain-containing protein n=1 Tax=Nesidiocoris tenuis TaxID=355587 RepID=A0A6H5FVK8_9HEMI|nr:unnamed protein product [Nesidiocoris tenuis]